MKYTFIFLFASLISFGQTQLCSHAKTAMKLQQIEEVQFPGDPNIDVSYYGIDIEIVLNPRLLSGSTVIGFKTVNSSPSYSFDLLNTFLVDSVLLNGQVVDFTHENDKINIAAPLTLDAPQLNYATVYYRGVPIENNIKQGIYFDVVRGTNIPVVYTLSEPYGAPSWFACKDNPADKADSCDISITMPDLYMPISNGLITEEVQLSNSRKKTTWSHRYPIAHYLISIAASQYTLIEQTWNYGDSISMPVTDYIYPNVATNPNLQPLLNLTFPMLDYFSESFGIYPYYKEKYGHAMFNFGGGMEHQTISSMGTFNQDIIAHELAHQWFGNKVTCETWEDIWVNEGFASFCELLFEEHLRGKDAYLERLQLDIDLAKRALGTIAVQNTNSISEIFNFPRSYAKGAVVLHMLRGVMGDDKFFAFMYNLANGEFEFGAASIRDIQKVAEEAYGASLEFFFDQWLYSDGYPKLTIDYQYSDKTLVMDVAQQTIIGSTPFFTMPFTVEATLSDGSTERKTVDLTSPSQSFNIGFTGEITDIAFDPEKYLLADYILNFQNILSLEESSELSFFPNPSQEYIRFKNDDISKVEAIASDGSVFDIRVENQQASIKHLSAGAYTLRLNTPSGIHTYKWVKL